MAAWQDDDELIKLMRQELFTAVVGDVLDTAGMTRQFLPPQTQANQAGFTKIHICG